jgi:hypothetical protein
MKGIIGIALFMFAVGSLAMAQPGVTVPGPPLTVAGVRVYGIADNGDLYSYFHQGAHNGSSNWANGGQGIKVAEGWNEGWNVFKGSPRGDQGVIYRVHSNGDLYWNKHFGRNEWAQPRKVGNGWQGHRIAFAAGGGILYLIDRDGDLLWYRHLGYEDGSDAWANGGNGVKVGHGWSNARFAFSGENGIIYMVHRNGDLYWYRHTGYSDGKDSWANGGQAVRIGNGWNAVASAFSGGDGVIYAMKRDGDLYWYNHTGFANGNPTWASAPTGNVIGRHWGGMVRIF